MDRRESGADLVGREHLPRVAQRREAVRRPRSEDCGRGSRPDAGRGIGVHRRDRQRRHRGHPARQGHPQFPPVAGHGKRPGQDLLRQRDAGDAL